VVIEQRERLVVGCLIGGRLVEIKWKAGGRATSCGWLANSWPWDQVDLVRTPVRA
jgi:hypothetical protein